MTYVGVNYVLAAGLHSYGFGGGRVVQWMLILICAEVLYLAVGFVAHRRNLHMGRGAPAPQG
jgi:hypothetical protein